MADDTQTAAPPQDDAIAQALRLAQILQGQQQPIATPQPQERSFVSLLGSALGSGSTAPTADEEDAGRRALMSFGINMLQAGGPSLVKRSFGQALAQGLSGAGESELQSQQLAAARLGAQQDYQQKQQEMRLNAIKEAIPLLTMAQLSAAKRAALSTGAAPGGGPPSIGAVTGNPPTIARGDTSTPAGWVANNPGNLMYAGQPGVSGTLPLSGGRTLAAFPDIASGVSANANQILINQDQHGINTVRGMVNYWVNGPNAKPGEGPDLTTYVNDAAKRMGVDPDKPINFHDQQMLEGFILAQQPHETGGKGITLNPADVTAGVTRALTPRAAPGGTGTATAATPPPATPTPPAASTAPPGGGFGTSAFAAPTQSVLPAPETTANAPNVAVALPPVPSPAMTAASAIAAKTGKPAPIAGGQGLVANPDGTVGTPGAGGVGKRADLEAILRGVQTAQTTMPPAGAVAAAGPAAGGGGGAVVAPAEAPAGAFGGGAFAAPPARMVGQPPPQTASQQPAPTPTPAVATAPAQPAPPRVPDTFVPPRVDLPAEIQQRIDNPVPPDQLQQLNLGVQNALNSQELNAATKARAEAMATGRAAAQKEAQDYRDKAAASAQEVWKQLRVEQQANDTAAATRAQEERMAIINSANTRLNAEAEKQTSRNDEVAKTYGAARDAGINIMANIDQLAPVLKNLPEGAAPLLRNEQTRSSLASLFGWSDPELVKHAEAADLFEQGMGRLATQLSPLAPVGTVRSSMVAELRAQLPTLSQSADGRELAMQYVRDLARNQAESMNWLTMHKEDPQYFNKRLGVPDADKALIGLQENGPKMPPMPPLPSSFDPARVTAADARANKDYMAKVKPGDPYYAWETGDDGRLHAVRHN